jgi:hypothetical protein
MRLGAQLVEMGRAEEAKAQYRAALEVAGGYPPAVEQLALLQSREENAPLLPVARKAAQRAAGPDAASLNFALAHMHLQAGDIQAGDAALLTANRAKARQVGYDPRRDAELHTKLAGFFAPGALPAPNDGDTGPVPIFVLGLPRSGTSLTEAVLSGHGDVAPLGEQALAGLLLRDVIAGEAAFDAAGFARDYRARMPDLPDGARSFTDKMPENYRLIGFLLTAFPQARIVHLRRDPRDAALSLWRGHFSGSALGYAYDLAGMAQHFNAYARLMAHWHAVFPGRILDLDYEALAGDVEAQSRRLADWCGLNWQPAMATPEHTTMPVLTLSAAQLRRPVDTRSVGKWRGHEAALAPFTAGLDPGLWPEVAGSAASCG